MSAKPVVALVGRPNVGKSTLFNRLTRSRDALVADLPGLTRDRHYGEGRLGPRPYLVVDTGGFEPVVKEGITFQMAKQTRQAIAESDAVVFVVDGRTGLAPQDLQIADLLRKSGRPHHRHGPMRWRLDRPVRAHRTPQCGLRWSGPQVYWQQS